MSVIDEIKQQQIEEQLNLWALLYPGKPLQIGLKVRVHPDNEYAADWNEDCVVTGVCVDHHKRINITIAESLTDSGSDGWGAGDLIAL